jgi:hypothetical protein
MDEKLPAVLLHLSNLKLWHKLKDPEELKKIILKPPKLVDLINNDNRK